MKRSMILSICLQIIGFSLLLSMTLDEPPFGLPQISMYTFITVSFLFAFLVQKLGISLQKKDDDSSKTGKLLLDHCDPQSYINAVQALLDRCPQNGQGAFDEMRKHYQLAISTGEIAFGKIESATQILKSIDFSKLVMPSNQIVYLNNYIAVLLHNKDLLNAQKYLNLMDAISADSKIDPTLRPIVSELCRSKNYQLQMAKGDFTGAEGYFKSVVDRAKNMYEKVNAHYFLSQVYEHNGDNKEAENSLRFVAENGNKICIAEQARQQLAYN